MLKKAGCGWSNPQSHTSSLHAGHGCLFVCLRLSRGQPTWYKIEAITVANLCCSLRAQWAFFFQKDPLRNAHPSGNPLREALLLFSDAQEHHTESKAGKKGFVQHFCNWARGSLVQNSTQFQIQSEQLGIRRRWANWEGRYISWWKIAKQRHKSWEMGLTNPQDPCWRQAKVNRHHQELGQIPSLRNSAYTDLSGFSLKNYCRELGRLVLWQGI